MTVYARVLGPQGMAALAPECRALHAGMGPFFGQITVEVSGNRVLRGLLRVAGFPRPASDAPLRFERADRGGVEMWSRHIADQTMRTVQWDTSDGCLAERMGAMTAISRLVPVSGGLDLTEWRFRILGVSLPRWAAPQVTALERPNDGRYCFEIVIRPPWGDTPLVQYRGWLATLED